MSYGDFVMKMFFVFEVLVYIGNIFCVAIVNYEKKLYGI